MIRHCYACSCSFGQNRELAGFPVARRIAFDPVRGRLWAICDSCGRWSLTPIESRWEALEELERVVQDRGRLEVRTANIALFRAGSLRIVRVGPTDAREEGWWRYGRKLRRRRLRYASAAGVGATTVVAGIAGVGIATLSLIDMMLWGAILKRRDPFELVADIADSGARGAAALDRAVRFGRFAWRGTVACDACGAIRDGLSYRDRGRLVIADGWLLRIACAECNTGHFSFDAAHSLPILRRALAYHNYAGGSARQIEHAARAIRDGAELRRDDRYIGMAEGVGYQMLALEMLVNDQIERELLELSAGELEARWRVEEQIAGIADGELTPV